MQTKRHPNLSPSFTSFKQQGFTLVEVFMSIVIFGIFIASIFQYLKYNLDLSESARDLNRVTQIMQHQVEDLRSTKWMDLPKLEGKTIIPLNQDGIPVQSSGTIPFNWQKFSLTQNVTLSKTGFYKAIIVASWTDRQGKNYARRVETWLANEGLNAYYTRST